METLLTPWSKILMALIITLGIAVFAFRVIMIIRLVAAGRSEHRLDHFGTRLIHALKHTFLQNRVLRNRVTGLAHLALFYGFLVFGLGTFNMLWRGFTGEPFLGLITESSVFIWLVDVFAILVIVAVLVSAYRRYVIHPPEVLNTLGAAMVLLTVFLLMVSALVNEAAGYLLSVTEVVPPVGALLSGLLAALDKGQLTAIYVGSWWAHILLVVGFLAYIPYSKHMHLVVSPFNNFLHSLQPKGVLSVADLDSPEAIGAGQFQHFKWKHLLNTFACTQCGRCLQYCPSHLTERPLTPRQMILDLKRGLLSNTKKGGQAQAGSGQNNPVADAVGREAVWACTTCLACQEHCPVLIEHVDKIVDVRRFLLESEGASPSLSKALEGMALVGNPDMAPPSQRTDFLERLGIPVIKPDANPDIVLWVGCAGALNPAAQDSIKALVKVLKAAGVNAAHLGAAEKCCGDPARRIGEEGLFQALAKENIAGLQALGVKKLLTCCPHCYNTLKNEYPQLGGTFEVVHHTEFVLDLVQTERIKLDRTSDQDMTYHDPCYLGRYNDIYDAPRKLLQRATTGNIREMGRLRDKAVCCGGGGGQMYLESVAGKRVNQLRFAEVEELAVPVLVTACPYCKTMMDDAARYKDSESKVRVKDIVEMVSETMSV